MRGGPAIQKKHMGRDEWLPRLAPSEQGDDNHGHPSEPEGQLSSQRQFASIGSAASFLFALGQRKWQAASPSGDGAQGSLSDARRTEGHIRKAMAR